LCGELAFKKMQTRRFPEEKNIAAEVIQLRRNLFEIIELNHNE
jgi:hypothetical protein